MNSKGINAVHFTPSTTQAIRTFEPVNFTHALYLVIDEFPGSRISELRKILQDRDQPTNNMTQAIDGLLSRGNIRYSQTKGLLTDVDSRSKMRWYTSDKIYKPKITAVKMARVKSVEIKKEEPVVKTPAMLTLIQGIASLDANDPNFSEAAKDIVSKTGDEQSPSKDIITGIFLEVGNQTLVVTAAQFKQLFKEMKSMMED
jgi:hypothetical protein